MRQDKERSIREQADLWKGYWCILACILLVGRVSYLTLRPFSCDSIAIGYATFGDRITFSDIKGNIYYSYLTDVDFAFSGSTSFSCNAKSMEDIDADYPDSMQVEVDNLKKDSEKKITAYDAKLKHSLETMFLMVIMNRRPPGQMIQLKKNT